MDNIKCGDYVEVRDASGVYGIVVEGALLDLLEVETALGVSSQVGKSIPPTDAQRLAQKIERARSRLQQVIQEVTKMLTDGYCRVKRSDP